MAGGRSVAFADVSKRLEELNGKYPPLTQAPVLTEREEARE